MQSRSSKKRAPANAAHSAAPTAKRTKPRHRPDAPNKGSASAQRNGAHELLIEAVSRSDRAEVESLIAGGVRPKSGAMLVACGSGNLVLARMLHEAGASLKRPTGTPSLFFMACSLGRTNIARWLKTERSAVADVKEADALGRTALMAASGRGHMETVRYLCEIGADPSATNKQGANALMFASSHGFADVVRYFADERFAELGATDVRGFNALALAAHHSRFEIVKLLAARGARDDAADVDGDDNALLEDIGDGNDQDLRRVPLVTQLRSRGGEERLRIAEWLRVTRGFATPLHYHRTGAITPAETRSLLRAGANIDAPAAALCGAGGARLATASCITPRSLAARQAESAEAAATTATAAATATSDRAQAGGASEQPAASSSTSEVPREMTESETEAAEAAAALVRAAGAPWGRRNHELFPATTRAHAFELLVIGALLAKKRGLGGGAFGDCWFDHVMPFALGRSGC